MYQIVSSCVVDKISSLRYRSGVSTTRNIAGIDEKSSYDELHLFVDAYQMWKMQNIKGIKLKKEVNNITEPHNYYEKGMVLLSKIKGDGLVLDELEFCQLSCALLHNMGIPIEEIYIVRVVRENIALHQFCLLSKTVPSYRSLHELDHIAVPSYRSPHKLDRIIHGEFCDDVPWVVDCFFEIACHHHQYTWHLRDACRKLSRNKKEQRVSCALGALPIAIRYIDFFSKLVDLPLSIVRAVPQTRLR